MYEDYNQDEKKNLIFFAVREIDFSKMFDGESYRLSNLCSGWTADLVILCSSTNIKNKLESESGQEWLKDAHLDEYITDILDVTCAERTDLIQKYLDTHEHGKYVIIDYEELEPSFPGHTVYLSDIFDESAANRARRLLRYPPFGEKTRKYNIRGGESDLIDDGITKAIFLDVDGVLNDDGKRRSAGEIICPEYVENLAWIVEETGAQIILSSSWRYGFAFEKKDEDIQALLDEFAKYHLRIAGITPLYMNGSWGRPYEIRTWLTFRHKLKNFVILDDDAFWSWEWLSDRFVRTTKIKINKRGGQDFKDGLTRDFAQRAIDILNGKDNETC